MQGLSLKAFCGRDSGERGGTSKPDQLIREKENQEIVVFPVRRVKKVYQRKDEMLRMPKPAESDGDYQNILRLESWLFYPKFLNTIRFSFLKHGFYHVLLRTTPSGFNYYKLKPKCLSLSFKPL